MSILLSMLLPAGVRPARRLRAKAFVLLAVFLTAGTSLPGLDAIAHHWGRAELQRSQPHVEPAGGCLNHYGHCTLGRTAPGSGSVGTWAGIARVEPMGRPAAVRLPTFPPVSTFRGAIPQPRAPPALRYV